MIPGLGTREDAQSFFRNNMEVDPKGSQEYERPSAPTGGCDPLFTPPVGGGVVRTERRN